LKMKIMIGHSGWGPGQLDREIEQGAWLSLPCTEELVFMDDSEMWAVVSRQIGRSMLQSMLHIKQLPEDPQMN
jgi:putative transcriptional regulator